MMMMTTGMPTSMAQRIAIIGEGQMGLVLSEWLSQRGHEVRLWGPFPEHVAPLQQSRQAPHRLPDFRVPESVLITADEAEALDGATLIVNAIPTQYIAAVWKRICKHVAQPAEAQVVCVSKGIENTTLRRPSQIIADALAAEAAERDGNGAPEREAEVGGGADLEANICALSGPTIAKELAAHLPAAMVAASHTEDLTYCVQYAFSTDWVRIYRLHDVLGVEIAGAAKNVVALAAGMADGIEAGYNAKSALLARGLAEISRLGVAMGAEMDTFFGIAGVGDLATTCFSPSGRNRTCGQRLGQGEPLDEILRSMPDVVEGIPTSASLRELSARYDVEMPITDAVYRIVHEGLEPRQAIGELMSREPKAEVLG